VLEVDRPEKNVSFHVVKLPNLLGIQPSAFDESTNNEADEEQEYQGYVHNMVRWRYKQDSAGNMVRDDDGKLIRESNTKLVTWSDGSYTMNTGNEAFDIQAIGSSSNGFAGLNGFIYLSQKSTFSNECQDEETPGDTVLECAGTVLSRFVTKPSSLQPDSHKSLTVAVRQKTIKEARIPAYVTQEDPEKIKQERIRINQDESKILWRTTLLTSLV
jgi:RNA polymerase-associated protein LEO1